jgi:uncharacterized protein (TIGR00266 family)
VQYEIECGPAFAVVTVTLDAGEQVVGEGGAMVEMSPGLEVSTEATGGVLKGLKRKALGGTSFFMNTYSAKEGGAVTFGAKLPGDVVRYSLADETMYVQSGSFLAAAGDIDVDTKWGGAKTFFSREGLFLLKCSGTGELFVSSFGAIRNLDLAAGQSEIIDSGHMVAFTDGVEYKVRKFGGWKSTILGGEGLVVELTGPGRAAMQTRSPEGLVEAIAPLLPKQND